MNIRYLLFFLVISLFYSCKNEIVQDEVSEEYIQITEEQFDAAAMKIGAAEKHEFFKTIDCNGSIITTPNGKAEVSLPISCSVKTINLMPGQAVQKGQVLFVISGVDFIDLQNEFVKSSANLKRIKSEYERAKTLYNEKIGTEKELILAESEYISSKANNGALLLKLNLLGISTSEIEDGKLKEFCEIKSPIYGRNSKVNASIGQFASQGEILMEIIDDSQAHLKLSVFPKDIHKLKANQKVLFNLIGDSESQSAVLSYIGTSINMETKAIDCYATIQDNILFPVINSSVEAKIITEIDTVLSLPSEAFIKGDAGLHVLEFVKKEKGIYFFKRLETKHGRFFNEQSEFISNSKGGKYLIKGVYNLTF